MPIYVYEVILEDGEDGQIFEVVQKMSDPPLTKHPISGMPVRRVIQPPNLPQTWTDRQTKHMLSDKHIGDHGLTRYEREADGAYRKTAGKGPDTFQKPSGD